jgi:hypothetical protein
MNLRESITIILAKVVGLAVCRKSSQSLLQPRGIDERYTTEPTTSLDYRSLI